MPASIPRRQVILLAALVVALAAVLAYQFWPAGGTAAGGPAAPPRGARAKAGAGASGGLEAVPDLKLAELTAPRPEPADKGRNLFREQPKAPPPPPPSAIAARPKPDPNAPPPPPPPPPPITLKFIGLVQQKGVSVAVLTDGKDIFYGREGETLEGKYRIIRIGVESVELSYLDGRGRQRIPLSG